MFLDQRPKYIFFIAIKDVVQWDFLGMHWKIQDCPVGVQFDCEHLSQGICSSLNLRCIQRDIARIAPRQSYCLCLSRYRLVVIENGVALRGVSTEGHFLQIKSRAASYHSSA